jgi:hypothetical protein
MAYGALAYKHLLCRYLFLLFDSDNFIRQRRYVFNTEGHPFLMRPGRPNMTSERVQDWQVARKFSSCSQLASNTYRLESH